MDDEEYIEVYDSLMKILDEKNLTWINEQVIEQVQLGKPIEKEVVTFKESGKEPDLFNPNDGHVKYEKGRKATFLVTVQYTAQEKLMLLIDAIEQAIVNTAEMEYEVMDYFGKELGNNWQGIEFHSSEGDNNPSLIINRQTLPYRLESSQRLKQILDALRKQIN